MTGITAIRNIQKYFHTQTCTLKFNAASFITTKHWKLSKYPLTGDA